MRCTTAFSLVCLGGRSHTGVAASNLKSAGQRSVWRCGRGRSVAMLSRFSTNTTLEATMLGKVLEAAGPDVSVVSLHGWPQVLTEAFSRCVGSWYRAKLVDYPPSGLRLLKRCVQRTVASVFGSLDKISKMEFVVSCWKCAEIWDWISSHPALRRAITTIDLSMQA